jgi:hypothetical protein
VKETVAYCDLDDKDARRPGVAVLKVEVDGTTHVVDVCQVHLSLIGRLPTGVATRGRRRAVKRATKRVAKRVAPAAPAKAAKKAAAPARKRAAVKAVRAKKVAKAPAKKAPAKRVAKATRRSAVAGRVSGSRRDQQQRIAAARDWARAQGRPISGKGRLPAGLLEEFERSSR